jgi:hypothetical protein
MKEIKKSVTWGVTFWTTGFRAEQMNGAESTSIHSATHLLGSSNIVSILFLIAISVSLTSLNM